MKRIAVVGGGISGLTVAYALLHPSSSPIGKGGKEGLLSEELEITVFEADGRPGGKIWSDKVNGFLCEKGPNGFLDNKPKTLDLCKSLGIDPVRSNENSKKRFIFCDGRLKALPESPMAFIKSDLLSWAGKLRILMELNAPKGPSDETVADFITRRLGSEALEKLIDPMASGIYAGNPDKMSIRSCFPRIKELEWEYGSLIKALFKLRKQKKIQSRTSPESTENNKVSAAPGGTLTSFFNGAQTITEILSGKLGDRLKLGISVHGIAKNNDSYLLYTSGGNVEADIVVLASPAYASAEIVKELDNELSNVLSDIPYPHVSVVCFGFRKENVTNPLKGFGFLIPHKERRKILGTLWDSSIFPNRASEGNVLLRTMIGGAQYPETSVLDDNKIIDTVFDELKPILGLKSDPDMVRIYRWEKAIPQYVLGHVTKLKTIDERLKTWPGLYLTGNAYRGIGINDCVENSYRLADEILRNI